MLKLDREREIEDLEDLKKKTDKFVGEIFDWVRCLNSIYILQHLHDFNQEIQTKITELKNVKEEDDAN